MDPCMQISEVLLKVCRIGLPRQPVHPRGGVALEHEERLPEQIDALCGYWGASFMVRIGAKQTSVPSMISHQSSRVLDLKTSISFCFSSGQALRSICLSKSASVSPACSRSNA